MILWGIARWDGSTWYQVGAEKIPGLTTYDALGATMGYAMTVRGNDVFVGGDFLQAGHISASRIARWDGTTWNQLSSGEGKGAVGYILEIQFAPNGDMIVGGNFNQIGNLHTRSIARWDGMSWHPFGSGVKGEVTGIVFAENGDMYISGLFLEADGVAAYNVARWDGSQWHALIAGDSNGVRSWDTIYGSSANSIAIGPDGNIYVGGYFQRAGESVAYNIARWDGENWYPVSYGVDNAVWVVTFSPIGDLIVGAGFGEILRLNEYNDWDIIGGGVRGARVYEVKFHPNGDMYVGGQFGGAGPYLFAGGILRWTGGNWDYLGESESCNGLNPYPCLGGQTVKSIGFDSDGYVYAGGQFNYAASLEVSNVARWDGIKWYSMEGGVTKYSVYSPVVEALATKGKTIYFGGELEQAGQVAAGGLAVWHDLLTSVDDPKAKIPRELQLYQNYPNPFNSTTVIKYDLPTTSKVNLKIYNTLGNEVATIVNRVEEPGEKEVRWDASKVSSGVYFCRIETISISDPSVSNTLVEKMLLIK